MTKNILLVFFVLISYGCNFSINKSNEINIYSQRHYDSDKMQYKKFEEKTGIKVNVTKAGADELIQRLKNEGDNSQADLFITVDVGKLWQASDMGLFQKFDDQDFAITDLSYSRTIIELEGKQTDEVLKKGCPLNINEFKKGDCANSVYNGIAITIDFISDDPKKVRIFGLRSFGESLYHSITDSSLEYGYLGN